MSLANKSKKEIITEFANDKKDTGSAEVQCAIITKQIENLTQHLKQHKKDYSSRRGLMILVGKRRSLLDYLKSKSSDRYGSLIKKLGLRK